MDSRQNGRSGLDIGLWPEKLRMIIAKDEMYGSFFLFFFFFIILTGKEKFGVMIFLLVSG